MRGKVVAGVLLCAVAAAAESTIFRWVDAKGNLHATDRLGDVPEPYYGIYFAEQKRREAERQAGGATATPHAPPPTPEAAAPASTGPSGASVVDEELRRREQWRSLVSAARNELMGATAALAGLEEERAVVAQNPLLAVTPAVQARLGELEQRRAAVLVRLEKARAALLVDLPARARKENVSPKWLE